MIFRHALWRLTCPRGGPAGTGGFTRDDVTVDLDAATSKAVHAVAAIAVVAAASVAGATLAASPSAAAGVTSQLDAGHRWMLASAGEQSPSGRFQLFLYPDGGGIELDEVVHTNQAIALEIQPGDINRNCRRGYLAMQTQRQPRRLLPSR